MGTQPVTKPAKVNRKKQKHFKSVCRQKQPTTETKSGLRGEQQQSQGEVEINMATGDQILAAETCLNSEEEEEGAVLHSLIKTQQQLTGDIPEAQHHPVQQVYDSANEEDNGSILRFVLTVMKNSEDDGSKESNISSQQGPHAYQHNNHFAQTNSRLQSVKEGGEVATRLNRTIADWEKSNTKERRELFQIQQQSIQQQREPQFQHPGGGVQRFPHTLVRDGERI